MPWYTPLTAVPGNPLSAAAWNDVRDDLLYLAGRAGMVTIFNDYLLTSTSTAADATTVLYFGDSSGVARSLIAGRRNGSGTGGILLFDTVNDSGSVVEAMRINQVQNVGIGTSTPATRLHLSQGGGGAIFWGGNITTNSTVIAAAGTVSNYCSGVCLIRESTGAINTPAGNVAKPASSYNSNYLLGSSGSANFLRLDCASDGSLTLVRGGSTGTATYLVSLWLLTV